MQVNNTRKEINEYCPDSLNATQKLQRDFFQNAESTVLLTDVWGKLILLLTHHFNGCLLLSVGKLVVAFHFNPEKKRPSVT